MIIINSKWKWIFAVIVLVLFSPRARSQCSNGPCYAANAPAITWMTNTQAASQGIMTMTVNVVAATDPTCATTITGSNTSHVLTIVPNTTACFNWSSSNGASGATAHAYLWINGVQHDQGGYPLNGTGRWGMGSGDVGSTYVLVIVLTNPNGQHTQDQITVKVVAGTGPAFVYQDNMPINFIVKVNSSGGGGSMLNDFTMCQGGNQQHCINATHTPYTALTLTNQSSGETQSNPRHQSGNIARANESVSFGDYIFISALTGDQLNLNEDDEVICSLSGPIGVAGGGSSPVSVEWAWTVAQKLPSPPCEQVPGGGIRCYMQYACTPDSSPPDYRPVQIFTLQFGTVDMPDYWLSGNLCFSIFGAPYLCPGAQIAGGIPGSGDWWKFVLAPGIPWTNKPFECTKASAGKGVTIPWPF